MGVPKNQDAGDVTDRRKKTGRPKGSRNRNTRVIEELANRILAGETGTTPLEAMLTAMRRLLVAARSGEVVMVDGRERGQIDLLLLAAEVASKAAPYVHPRLANVGSPQNPVDGYEAFLLALAAEQQHEADGAAVG